MKFVILTDLLSSPEAVWEAIAEGALDHCIALGSTIHLVGMNEEILEGVVLLLKDRGLRVESLIIQKGGFVIL